MLLPLAAPTATLAREAWPVVVIVQCMGRQPDGLPGRPLGVCRSWPRTNARRDQAASEGGASKRPETPQAAVSFLATQAAPQATVPPQALRKNVEGPGQSAAGWAAANELENGFLVLSSHDSASRGATALARLLPPEATVLAVCPQALRPTLAVLSTLLPSATVLLLLLLGGKGQSTQSPQQC